MNYLRLSLVALLFVTKTIASEESNVVLAQKHLDGLSFQVYLEKKGGGATTPSLVCKLTNKGAEGFIYGHGTRAFGFVLSATALDGKRAEYSPRAKTLFDPIAYISYGHVPIKAGGSIEYVAAVKDIQSLFLTPIKTLRIEWSRGNDPMGNRYPDLSGAFVDLDINLIIEAARRLGGADEASAPLPAISKPAPESVAPSSLEPTPEPLKSRRAASISVSGTQPHLAKPANPIWWLIGAIAALAAVVLVLCRKKKR